MEVSGCMNREFVRQLLIENWGDVNATVEFIMTVGPDNLEFQREYLQEKEAEAKQPKKNITTTTATTITSTTTTTKTTTTTTTTTTKPSSNAMVEEDIENNDKKGEHNHQHQKKKNQVDTISEKENQPFVHPKLAKYYDEDNLSNKERKERARTEKFVQPEKPVPAATTPAEVVDVSAIAMDLGSMQI